MKDTEGNDLVIGNKYIITDEEEVQEYPLIFRGIRDGALGRRLRFSDARSPDATFEVDPDTIVSAEHVFEEEEQPFHLFQVRKSATRLTGTRTDFESCYAKDPTGANCALISTAALGVVSPADVDFFIHMPGSGDIQTLLPILQASAGDDKTVSFHPHPLAEFLSVMNSLGIGYVTLLGMFRPGAGHMVIIERLGSTSFRILDHQSANREGFASVQTGTLEELQEDIRSRGYDTFGVFQGPRLEMLLPPPRLANIITPGKMDVKTANARRIMQEKRARLLTEQLERGVKARQAERARRRAVTMKAGRRKSRAKTSRTSGRKTRRS